MINVKEAIKSSTSYVQELFPGAHDIQLEEVEPSSKEWSVVLSFKGYDAPTTLATVMSYGRLYKQILVDLDSGEPKALKAWKQ